ncbi:MAG: tryptophan synthase subunit alpha [Omnitrophica bacterium RIFCSPLOWO2_01_FULL_45_10]|nr:MAG: tryptophan synthase subunit alpha [Omnitrophica bacterium RIFCSPLOWO2_01_FULL_45_10]
MNRLDRKFKELNLRNLKAFAAYITAGDPGLDVTKRIVLALEEGGADIIELGIPFSDPLADGPTIQAASMRALKKRINLEKVFRLVKDLRKVTQIPVLFMTYYNPVLKYGLGRFFKKCSSNGVDGVIIPDLPQEEAKDVVTLGKDMRVATIFLAAPTSTKDRIRSIAKVSRGFIYYVSLTGVTGARARLPQDVTSNVKLIKAETRKPVLVGFGVSTAGQARSISRIADGVIVGSAIVKIIEESAGDTRRLLSRILKFSKKLAKAVHNA